MSIRSFFRSVARRVCLTHNTLRYRLEFRCVLECFERVDPKPTELLDAGAGSGEMSLRLLHAGWCRRLTAVEPSETTFKILTRNAAALRNTVVLRAGLEKLPLADQSFDCVLSTQVFEHIPDDGAAADEVSRVTKPGGFAIISVPHPPELVPNPEHCRPGYTEAELRRLFEPRGYTHLHSEYFLTATTQGRLAKALRLPFSGVFVPVSLIDAESRLSNEARKSQQPYGICCLFRKSLAASGPKDFSSENEPATTKTGAGERCRGSNK